MIRRPQHVGLYKNLKQPSIGKKQKHTPEFSNKSWGALYNVLMNWSTWVWDSVKFSFFMMVLVEFLSHVLF